MLLQASDNVTALGVAVLENIDVSPERKWFWIGASALLGFAVLFNVLYTFALMFLNRKKTILFKVYGNLLLLFAFFQMTVSILFFSCSMY